MCGWNGRWLAYTFAAWAVVVFLFVNSPARCGRKMWNDLGPEG